MAISQILGSDRLFMVYPKINNNFTDHEDRLTSAETTLSSAVLDINDLKTTTSGNSSSINTLINNQTAFQQALDNANNSTNTLIERVDKNTNDIAANTTSLTSLSSTVESNRVTANNSIATKATRKQTISGTGIANLLDYGGKSDGVTDNGPFIQAAIDALTATGGGIVYIPVGLWAVNSPVTIKENIRIVGGATGHLRTFYDHGTRLIVDTDFGDVFTIATASNYSGLEDLEIFRRSIANGSGGTSNTFAAIKFTTATADGQQTDSVILRNLSIAGMGRAIEMPWMEGSLTTPQYRNILMDNIRIQHCKMGIVALGISDCQISNVTLDRCFGDNVSLIYPKVPPVGAESSTTYGGTVQNFINDLGNSTITKLTVLNGYGEGIVLQDSTGTTLMNCTPYKNQGSGLVVSGGTARVYGLRSTQNAYSGVFIQASDKCDVSDVELTNCRIDLNQRHGVYARPVYTDVKISRVNLIGCQVVNNSAAGMAMYAGLDIITGNLNVTGGWIGCDAAHPNQVAGSILDGDYVQFSGVSFLGCTNPINSNIEKISVQACEGISYQGFQTPALPSEIGINVPNMTFQEVTVYISADAVGTHITDINNVDTAIPNGVTTLKLGRGESIYFLEQLPTSWTWYLS